MVCSIQQLARAEGQSHLLLLAEAKIQEESCNQMMFDKLH